MSPCVHNVGHVVECRVVYLEDTGRYYLEIQARCADCGTRFAFLGMKEGLSRTGPACSIGRLEAFLPIEPDPHMTSLLAEPGREVPRGPDRVEGSSD